MSTPASLHPNIQLALDTIHRKPTRGIPSFLLHVMEHAIIERLAGAPPGSYRERPEEVYLAFQRAIGTCVIDQWIPTNPLTMGPRGWEGERGATTGAEEVVRDGIRIASPEAVAEHLERVEFPRLRQAAAEFDEEARLREILEGERRVQGILAPSILKSGYGFVRFPGLAYSTYGYVPYFSAYALYPELMERHFALQADIALRRNRAAARAYTEGGLPPLYRLDHDMADSRGTLARIETLDRLWLPHFARAIEPLVKAGVRLLWHCDGNLMAMVPRLLDAGVGGFQGFQYEDGMDYARICRTKSRAGDDLMIIAGVSVTRTLPNGTPADVKRELVWLVENGPKRGLFLAASSSIAPGTPWENILTLVEGLRYYREEWKH
ncbi:MAG: hypothetical protein HY321_12175 [Armatimonadetes bacterium]|nr:hypothetical protein [Armatimonadota bacterium]